MGIRCCTALVTLALALSWHAGPAAAAVLTFETPGEYDANFRELLLPAEIGQTNNGAANDYVAKSHVVATNAASTAVYDTTPASAAVKDQFAAPVTVSFDARVGLPNTANANGSVGIYIVNPANEAQGFLALFNVDDSGAGGQDRIRLFSGGNPTTAATGTTSPAATLAGNAGVTAGNAAFFPMSLTYAVSGTTPTMTLSAGSLTHTFTFPAGTAINNPEVALRLFDISGAGTTDVDNFEVIPEPAGAALMALAAGALALRRRCRGAGRG